MPASRLKSSVVIRMLIIGFLVLALLIPTLFVQGLVSERESRRNSALEEVGQKWGTAQTVVGPILNVPFKRIVKDDRGARSISLDYVRVLPEKLIARATLQSDLRYRGIYEVIVYSSNLLLTGEFASPDVSELDVAPENLLWKDAFLTLGVSDLKGLKEVTSFTWNGNDLAVRPGARAISGVKHGISARVPAGAATGSTTFALELNLNGSAELRIAPVGRETRVRMEGSWGEPSFVGDFLPEKREIGKETFAAEWKVLHLNRNYPQQWVGDMYDVAPSAFGTRLLLPIDEYTKTDRAVKYAIMFIALTFLAFFMSEVLTRVVLHPIHYTLVGLALVLFYLLLLSLSEQMSFNISYIIASAAVVSLVSLYSRAVAARTAVAGVMAGVLVFLYAFLFVLLQLQDYALLLGSVALFVILALVMYLTRTLDWFVLGRSSGEAGSIPGNSHPA